MINLISGECRGLSDFRELEVFPRTEWTPWGLIDQCCRFVVAAGQILEFIGAEDTGRSLAVGVVFNSNVAAVGR